MNFENFQPGLKEPLPRLDDDEDEDEMCRGGPPRRRIPPYPS